MSYYNQSKELECTVVFSDGSSNEFTVEIDYHEDDTLAVPEIGVNTTPINITEPLTGMALDFEDEVLDALNTYLTQNFSSIIDGDQMYFTFNTVSCEVEIDSSDAVSSHDELVEAISEVLRRSTGEELADIATKVGIEVKYLGDSLYELNRGN